MTDIVVGSAPPVRCKFDRCTKSCYNNKSISCPAKNGTITERSLPVSAYNPHKHHRKRALCRFRNNDCSFDNYYPHELLEIILFNCIPQRDTNMTAHRLAETFGSIEGVLAAPIDELCRVEGISTATATRLKLYGELLARIDGRE